MRKLKLDELNRASVAEFESQKKLPVTVVLDNVRSMHNIGSIFRTSDGFAVEQVCLCGISAQPPHREIEKTALGATQSVNWVEFSDTSEAVDHLRKNGYRRMAREPAETSIGLNNFMPKSNEK